MKHYLTCGLLLSCLLSFGQRIIELKSEPLDLPNRHFTITGVVDSRSDTTLIGIFATGFNDANKEKVQFANPLSVTLMDFLRGSLTKSSSENSVIMQVNKLALNQYTAYASVGFSTSKVKRQFAVLEANLSFYLKDGNGFYKILEKGYSFEERGISVGGKHSKNIIKLLKESLTDLSRSGMNIKGKEIFAWNEIKKGSSFPIMGIAQPKKGLYMNFSEFRNNNPSIKNIEIQSNPNDSTFRLFYFNDDGLGSAEKKEITPETKIWGFSDGQNAYIKQKSYYFNLSISNESVTFIGFDYYSLIRRKMIGPMIKSATLLGLTGGLIRGKGNDLLSAVVLSDLSRTSTAVIAKATIDMVAKRTIKEAQENIHVFKINMDNGEFIQKD
jgi:hypothetical protein